MIIKPYLTHARLFRLWSMRQVPNASGCPHLKRPPSRIFSLVGSSTCSTSSKNISTHVRPYHMFTHISCRLVNLNITFTRFDKHIHTHIILGHHHTYHQTPAPRPPGRPFSGGGGNGCVLLWMRNAHSFSYKSQLHLHYRRLENNIRMRDFIAAHIVLVFFFYCGWYELMMCDPHTNQRQPSAIE